MYDPFKQSKEEHSPVERIDTGPIFPNFNTQWLPPFEDGPNTKLGRTIEKGTDIVKKTFGLYMAGLGLLLLLILLPVALRFGYELSRWAFDLVGKIFH